MTVMKNAQSLRVMLAGLFSLILTLGVARFSYTPLLPVMLEETFLNNALGGWLATINYMGYMSGALVAATVNNLKTRDMLYRLGLIVAVLSTVGMALTENYVLWAVMRYLAGLSSAAGLLIGSGLVLQWMAHHGQKLELGLHFSGLGMGIALSAVLALLMANQISWVAQWQWFAVVGVILAVPAWLWLPRPDYAQQQSQYHLVDAVPRPLWMRLLFLAYFCAGVGYVVSATFLVVIAKAEPALNGNANMVWLVTGIAASPACILWDRIARKTGDINALLLAYMVNMVGIALPVLNHGFFGMMFSGVLFGVTFIGIVSLMLTMVGKFCPNNPAKLMGKLTLSYGVAQMVAPALSGMVAEATGHYYMPLVAAACVMFFGMLILAWLRVLPK